MQKSTKRFLYLCLFFLPLFLFAQTPALIPKPQKFTSGKGFFLLNEKTNIVTDSKKAFAAIDYLQAHLQQSASYTLQRKKSRHSKKIDFHFNPEKVQKSEAYSLHISKDKILIEARDQAGFFYATVTLLQLMDPAIWSRGKQRKMSWSLPVCEVEDYPRFIGSLTVFTIIIPFVRIVSFDIIIKQRLMFYKTSTLFKDTNPPLMFTILTLCYNNTNN